MHVEAALSFSLSFLRHHSCIWLPWTVAAIWAGSLSPRTVHGHTGNSARKWNRYWKQGPSCSTPSPLPTTPFIPALFIPGQCLLFLHIPSLCTSHPIPSCQGLQWTFLLWCRLKEQYQPCKGFWCTLWGLRVPRPHKSLTHGQLQLREPAWEQLERLVLSAARRQS